MKDVSAKVGRAVKAAEKDILVTVLELQRDIGLNVEAVEIDKIKLPEMDILTHIRLKLSL